MLKSLERTGRIVYLSGTMTPQAALELQVLRYRAMSREERVAIALRLHEFACEMTRLGIRRQHPGASVEQVEELLRQRLELARTL